MTTVVKNAVYCALLGVCVSASVGVAHGGRLHVTSAPENMGIGAETVEAGNAVAIGFETDKTFDYFEFDIVGDCINCEAIVYLMDNLPEDVPTMHDAVSFSHKQSNNTIRFAEGYMYPYEPGIYYVVIAVQEGAIVMPAESGEIRVENSISASSEWILSSPYDPVWQGRKDIKLNAQWHYEVRGY